LRYSALAAGVLYGLYHQATLSASAKLNAINRDYEHKQSLIQKAKAEFSKKNSGGSGDGGTFSPIHAFAQYASQ
jgi:F-type H+-transporting ATP synthase subunit e